MLFTMIPLESTTADYTLNGSDATVVVVTSTMDNAYMKDHHALA